MRELPAAASQLGATQACVQHESGSGGMLAWHGVAELTAAAPHGQTVPRWCSGCLLCRQQQQPEHTQRARPAAGHPGKAAGGRVCASSSGL